MRASARERAAGSRGAEGAAHRARSPGRRGAIVAHLSPFTHGEPGRTQSLTERQRSKLTWTIGLGSTVAALLILITLGTAAALRKRSSVQDVLYSGISRFVDELPADTKIGWWATPAAFYLYGKRLQHTVVYLALHEHAANSDDMLRYLSAQRVDLIAIGPLDRDRDLSPVWTSIVEKRHYFERLHGEDPRRHVMVYRLNPSGL